MIGPRLMETAVAGKVLFLDPNGDYRYFALNSSLSYIFLWLSVSQFYFTIKNLNNKKETVTI